MSKHSKALERLLLQPKDYTWSELITVMNSLGYKTHKAGGSRRKFISSVTGARHSMHEPHPSGILKAYQLRLIVAFLTKEGHLP